MHCFPGLDCPQLNVIQLTTSDIGVPPVAHLGFSADLRRLRKKQLAQAMDEIAALMSSSDLANFQSAL
jgi:hypothetical protein